MERKIMNDLKKWKIDTYKKPLLLYGVSGSGKTYTCLEFAKNEYKNVVYFDCYNNLELSYVIEKNQTIEKRKEEPHSHKRCAVLILRYTRR